MNSAHRSIRRIRQSIVRLIEPKNVDEQYWVKRKGSKPFRVQRTKPLENARFEIIGRKDEDDDWNPHNWIGKVQVANKHEHIALPPKIELCLSFELDSRYYYPEQNQQFYKASQKFTDFYNRRRAAMSPVDPNGVEKKYREIFASRVTTRENRNLMRKGLGELDAPLSEKDIAAKTKRHREQFKAKIKKRPNFSEIDYDEVISKIWTKTRVPHSYAAAFKVLSQLKEVGFEIQTMLDFGCGIGPGLWAATDLWPETIRMYDGVDKSYHQLRMGNYVVTGGDEDCLTDGIRFRRSMPEGTGQHREQYNLVLVQSALGDQRTRQERLRLLDKLWSKVHVKGGILVIIENGTLPGHELVQEARAHITENHPSSYAVAPCGHNARCGLFRPAGGLRNRDNVLEWSHRPKCVFPIVYEVPPWGHHDANLGSHTRTIRRGSYSYVVLAKGVNKLPVQMSFPRVIGKGSHGVTGRDVCVTCVNGVPVPLTAKRDRESHETRLQMRRLNVGDTMPIVERDEWEPTEFDYKLREHYRSMKREQWEMRERKGEDSDKEDNYWTTDVFDMDHAESPLAEFAQIFMDQDNFDPESDHEDY